MAEPDKQESKEFISRDDAPKVGASRRRRDERLLKQKCQKQRDAEKPEKGDQSGFKKCSLFWINP